MLTFDWIGGWFNFSGMIDPAIVFNGIRTLTPVGEGSFRARWHVPVDLPYFRGHFPGAPIFPAVGIVDATLHALRIHHNSPKLQITGISLAKFLSLVLPDFKVILDFKSLNANEWQCEWKDEQTNKLLTTLRVTCF